MSFKLPSITQGASFTQTYHSDQCSPADGWSLTVYFVGPQNFSVVASISNGSYVVKQGATQTATVVPGYYKYIFSFEKASTDERLIGYEDYVTIEKNPYTAPSGTDNRTHAQRTLANIEAVIEGRATTDQMRYQIDGRSLDRIPLTDLMKFRDYYKIQVQQERKTLPTRVATRFI